MKLVSKRLPIIMLTISTILTFINILIACLFPVIIPFSSFISVRLTVLGIVTGQYWLIAVSILGGTLMGITIFSIRNGHSLFPIVFNAYLIVDLIVLFPLFIQSICTQYIGMWAYAIHIVMDVVTFVLIIIYIRDLKTKPKTEFFMDSL